MYAVLVDEPYICDVLEGATLEEDGTVLVEGVQGSEQTAGKTEEPQAAGSKQEGVLEITYLMPKELRAPRPQKAELQKARSIAELSDDMDVKVFPHLFPTGTGGWQNGYGSLSQYARKRLLGLDPRFQASPAYIMWLLEMHIKKRLSGNINVRIGGQPPNAKSKYQEGRSHVFTALRDIPGTSSYVFAKKGVALNMYEQLGTPRFFMTLSCHARQPDILIAVIMARLLQLHPEKPPHELEREAAQILQCYQADKKFTWD
ncbi:pfh1, partial [Symbiodinium necroappetens]